MSSDNNFTAISRALADRAEEYGRHLFPSAKLLNGQLVVGSVLGEPGESLKITLRGRWAGQCKDFSTDWHGDLLTATQDSRALTPIQAADYARSWLGMPAFSSNGKHTSAFDPLKLFNPRLKRCGDAAWAYRDETGTVFAYSVRFTDPSKRDSKTGKPSKEFIPCRFIDGQWVWRGWKKSDDERAPIYGLHALSLRTDDPVLVVEGEKTADAATRLFPDYVCVSWLGGTPAVGKIDWNQLVQRNVVLWPDNDDAGRQAMLYIKARLPHARVVDTVSLPLKWDLADAAPDNVSTQGLLDGAQDVKPVPAPAHTPFTLLGYDDADYCYLPDCSGIVIRLAAAEHTELNLQRLATDDFWLNVARTDDGPDYKSIAKYLINLSHSIGPFDPSRIHGRGCSIDDGRTVYHAGDRLFVDGVDTPIREHKTKFIYPRLRSVDISLSGALTSSECQDFNTLCSLLPWKPSSPSPGWMFASTLFISPVCGALSWRPHSYLVGKSQSGKSWTYSNIMAPILGDTCLTVLSSSTAAGVRGELGSDAFPVLWDEFESKDAISRARIQQALELARQASSETGGSILKGTSSGHSKRYSIRSTFFFSSIASGAIDYADVNRINLYEFEADGDTDRFNRLKALAAKTVASREWCRRLRARAILLAAKIRAAAETFTPILAVATGEARTAQQLGPVFAGAWLMELDSPPTTAQAQDWVSRLPPQKRSQDHETDENRALRILLQGKIQHSHGDTRSVEELLHAYFQHAESDDGVSSAVYDTLMRHGIHPKSAETRGGGADYNCFDVANSHSELTRIFRDSPYESQWRDHLLGVPGSSKCDFRTVSNRCQKAVRIPYVFLEA